MRLLERLSLSGRTFVPALALAGALVAAAPSATGAEAAAAGREFAALEKIDVHMHLWGEMPELAARAREDGFRILTINVIYKDFPPPARQRADAAALREAHPDRFAFAATFDASDSRSAGWLGRTRGDLEAAFAKGAVAVKVWKDVGMQQRDADGKAVMIDDARFDPLFDWFAERRVPLLGHQGEPRNAWLPLEQMTIRGDRDYFSEHPQYHMARHPEWPSYEQQIAARNRMLEKHPDLVFVGVHLASLEWDVDRIAEFLRRFPNASVDLAARLSHLELQAVRDRERVRRFFVEFQDRILYGSDLSRGQEQGDAEFAREAHEVWLSDWQFLSGDAELRSEEFDGAFRGLALPREVLAKVYGGNARRIFPTTWRTAPGDGP
jgi:predicted TIM-barrel fold metal-dependent hydrolase